MFSDLVGCKPQDVCVQMHCRWEDRDDYFYLLFNYKEVIHPDQYSELMLKYEKDIVDYKNDLAKYNVDMKNYKMSKNIYKAELQLVYARDNLNKLKS